MTRKKSAAAALAEQAAFDNGTLPPQVPGLIWTTNHVECHQEWLLPGFIPRGHLVILEGRKGTGKTTFAAAVAASCAGGPVIPGWEGPRQGRVLWVPGEESYEGVTAPRLTHAEVPEGRFATWRVPEDDGKSRRPVLPPDIEQLADIIWKAHIVLIVLDPFACLAASTIDLIQEQSCRAYLDPLGSLCAETNCTALLLRNLKKGIGGDVRDAGRGSGTIGDVARSILRCDEHPHQKGMNVLSCVAINFGKPGAIGWEASRLPFERATFFQQHRNTIHSRSAISMSSCNIL